MTELERKRYFIELFGVDTSNLDQQIATAESSARDLRWKLKGYGEIDLTPIERIDPRVNQAEAESRMHQYKNRISESVSKSNSDAQVYDRTVQDTAQSIDLIREQIRTLMKDLKKRKKKSIFY